MKYRSEPFEEASSLTSAATLGERAVHLERVGWRTARRRSFGDGNVYPVLRAFVTKQPRPESALPFTARGWPSYGVVVRIALRFKLWQPR